MKIAVDLLNKCLANKEPELNLGNCHLRDEHFLYSQQIGRLLSQCTHLKKLILSNTVYDWDVTATENIDLNIEYIHNDNAFTDEDEAVSHYWQPHNYFIPPFTRRTLIESKGPIMTNRLSEIPDVIGVLDNLEEFVCGGGRSEKWAIRSLSPLKGLKKLKILDLFNNEISTTEFLHWFPNLEKLDLSNNHIRHFLIQGEYPKLKYLDLGGNDLTQVWEIYKFPFLRWLRLYKNKLKSMGELNRLKFLECLDLSNNSIPTLIPFEKNIALKDLNLSNNVLKRLDHLGEIPNLQCLFARHNMIYEIGGINNFMQLKWLDLSYNMIGHLPSGFNNLEKLQALDLSNNRLEKLSDIDRLKELETLNASNNFIREMNYNSSISSINTLVLNHNRLSELNFLSKFTKLKRLYASDNIIEKISRGEHPLLTHIGLSNNRINDLKFLPGCGKIMYVDLSRNNISSLHIFEEEGFVLSELKIFVATNNKITHLPNLDFFPTLSVLRLSDNQISEIDVLRSHNALEELDLRNNKISTILDISGFFLYKVLDLSDNPIATVKGLNKGLVGDLDIGVIDDMGHMLEFELNEKTIIFKSPYFNLPAEVELDDVESIKNWFIAKEQGVHINMEVKCILFGNGETGKTVLSHYYRTGKFYPVNDRTHGILIGSYKIKDKEWPPYFLSALKEVIENSSMDPENLYLEDQFTIHMWDFGGQEFYHATHRLFMSPDVLYLVLWQQDSDFQDEQKGNFPKEYWINNIQHYAPTGSILLVQNRANTDFVVEQDSRYKISTYKANNKELVMQYTMDMKVLMDAILKKITKLPHFGLAVPLVYHNIKGVIQKKRQTYISYDEYEKICIMNDQTEQQIMLESSQRESLIKYLDNIGSVVCFRHREGMNEGLIKDYVFTNPSWLTMIIYRILKKGKERFDLAHVEKIVTMYGIAADVWIKLMHNFGLIFKIKTEKGDNYIVPQYLPIKCSDEKTLRFALKNRRMTCAFTISYPVFMPNSNFLRLISTYGSEHLDYLYWKNGLVFFKNDTTVFIECINSIHERKIKVNVEKNDSEVASEILERIIEIDPGADMEISIDEVYYVPVSKLKKKIQGNKMEVEATNGDTLLTKDFEFLFKSRSPIKKEKLDKKVVHVCALFNGKDAPLQEMLVKGIMSHLGAKTGFEFKMSTDDRLDWDGKLKLNVSSADVIILLVSPGKVFSNFIKEDNSELLKEMNQEGKVILPVLLRNCDFASFEKMCGIQFFQTYYRDYGFTSHLIKDQFLSFDVLAEDDDTTDFHLNNYYINLSDKIYKAVANRFPVEV